MAFKRIKDLTNTAAESDLVSGNYFALDGSAGTLTHGENSLPYGEEYTIVDDDGDEIVDDAGDIVVGFDYRA